MAIDLNRKQLQETLREMGIRFPADASREELKEILEEANRRQWLKTAHAQVPGRLGQVIRRKGHASARQKAPPAEPPPAAPQPSKVPAASLSTRSARGPKTAPTPERSRPFKPKELVSTPVFDRTANLEAYALERANGVCELCERAPTPVAGGAPAELRPCYFTDPPEGSPRTVKTVAALCPECFERVANSPSAADLKLLKRKARRPRQAKIAVSSKSEAAKRPEGKRGNPARPADGRRPPRRFPSRKP